MISLIFMSVLSLAQPDSAQQNCMNALTKFEFGSSKSNLLITIAPGRSAGWSSKGFWFVEGDRGVKELVKDNGGLSGRYMEFVPARKPSGYWVPGQNNSASQKFTEKESNEITRRVLTDSFGAYYKMQQKNGDSYAYVAEACKDVTSPKIDGKTVGELAKEKLGETGDSKKGHFKIPAADPEHPSDKYKKTTPAPNDGDM